MIRILPYSRSHTVKQLGYSTSAHLDGRVGDYDRDVIIRWGNHTTFYNRFGQAREFRNVLNPAKAITLNINKIAAHKVLSEAVRTPKLFTRQTPARGTFVVRPYSHQGGSGFRVVEAKGQPINLGNYEYATEFLRTATEFRVWFVGDRTIRARRAPMAEKNQGGEKYPCRSNWGYIFYPHVPETLHNYTIRAAQAIGLDIGAADVLLANDKWYFLELNSSPSADLPILNRWMKNSINALCHERFRI
jgi:glutathione synthase/RimK-type ligase-like ATP-grasp enzyme